MSPIVGPCGHTYSFSTSPSVVEFGQWVLNSLCGSWVFEIAEVCSGESSFVWDGERGDDEGCEEGLSV